MKLSRATFVFWGILTLILSVEVIYQSNVIAQQAHVIRQYMGLEVGPDATPRMPAYVPPADLRSI